MTTTAGALPTTAPEAPRTGGARRATRSGLAAGLVVALAGLGCGGGATTPDAELIDAAVRLDGSSADAGAADAGAADAGAADAGALDASGVDAAPVVLTSTASITPGLGSLCGLGFDHVASEIWVYPCNGAEVHGFSTAGVGAGTVTRPGASANDVDVSFAPGAITIGVNAVADGAMMFIDGEAGVAEVHLPETVGSTPLTTAFGADHVVGGAVHAARTSLFLLQDRVSATSPNTIAELDPVTGAVTASFSTLPQFDVNYGDVEVCQSTGNLFVVSSMESTLAEFTAAGAFVAEYALPLAVTQASGLGLAPGGQAWVSGVAGGVWRLEGLPCP